eukprot:CAMPEP_0113477368 /NCGR_PEP_ID=MMETSP0014_2-20120614/20169_1 /TAXON_ID=2857 /ORGANISM="Nitzschia sp." /LENGTH=607 /DNA_ID=CAMNT_0000370455 /DNA_START=177 /DNA_END=2000 /DNA_ORIENTATION=- /assembly_acc=CAM_ASM_000159
MNSSTTSISNSGSGTTSISKRNESMDDAPPPDVAIDATPRSRRRRLREDGKGEGGSLPPSKKPRLAITVATPETTTISTCIVDSCSQRQQQRQQKQKQKHVHWRKMTENNNNEVRKDLDERLGRERFNNKQTNDGPLLLETRCQSENGSLIDENSDSTTTTNNEDEDDDNDDDDDGVYKTYYHLDDPAILFDEYNAHDIWFTNADYASFMEERIRTIERFRLKALTFEDLNGDNGTSSGNGIGNNSNSNTNNNDQYCMRGLEPFQDHVSHGSFHSKRNLHKSTVIMEQYRQTMLGLKDPCRFRFLVQSQSSLAQIRAIQLAAIDQCDVYPKKPLSSSQRSILISGSSSPTAAPEQEKSKLHSSLLHSNYAIHRQQCRGLESLSSLSPLSHRRSSQPILASATSSLSSSSSSSSSGVATATSDTTNTHPCQLHSSRSYESLSSLVNTNNDDVRVASLSTKDVFESTKKRKVNNNLHLRIANRPRVTSRVTNFPGLMMSPSPEMIQKFQENNARRLMEIYKPLLEESEGDINENTTGTGGEAKPHQSLFRFSLRRDSLSLQNTMSRHRQRNNHQRQQSQSSLAAAMAKSSRFQIRRDSLSHVHPSSSSS